MRRRRTVGVTVTLAVLAAACGGGGSSGAPSTTARPPTASTAPAADAAPAPTRETVGDEYFPELGEPRIDVERYDLDLDYEPATGALAGTVGIDATAEEDLAQFGLDLAGMEVDGVTVDGTDARFDHTDGRLEIRPAVPLDGGAPFRAEVAYHGTPVPVPDPSAPVDIGWIRDGRIAVSVDEPGAAHTWFPVSDHPSDKAAFRFRVTVPEGVTVVANGSLTGSETVTGRTTWEWTAEEPMASYLAVVAIGDFVFTDPVEVPGGVTVRHAFQPESVDVLREVTASTPDMLAFFSDVFGPYPFGEYGIIALPGQDFGLETQTFSLIGTGGAPGEVSEELLAHELAHQWFGDDVSLERWRDVWMIEGAAVYASWLWTDHTGAEDLASITASVRGTLSEFAADPESFGLEPLSAGIGDPGPERLFHLEVYLRGALTYDAIRQAIGDAAFRRAVRTFLARHASGNASTADLQGAAEEACACKLDALFAAWLGAGPVPTAP